MLDQKNMQDAVHVVCSIIEQNGRFLIARRPKGVSLELKWEFPGGKVDVSESEEEALKREIMEELGIEIEVRQRMTPSIYHYKDFTVNVVPYRCTILSGKPILREHMDLVWVDSESVREYDFVGADTPILEEYRASLGSLAKRQL